MLEVGGSNPDLGTIDGGVFHPNQATGKVFSTEYAIYCKFYFRLELCPSGETVNNRPNASPSFELVKPLKVTAISTILLYYYY